jgi:hypothetical protein
MVEEAAAKLERVSNDIDKIVELYDFAETLYPYDKIRDQR